MIVGIGTDLVRVSRIEEVYGRFGDRFVQRVLGEEEREEFAWDPQPVFYLAKRFAAKEAAFKALGTGFRGVRLRDAQVLRAPGGRPSLLWSGRAGNKVEQLGNIRSHVSLSDEAGFALAFVVLERVSPMRTGPVL